MTQDTIRESLQVLQKDIHQTAIDHGWYEGSSSDPLADPNRIPALLMLIVSEASEALEAFREAKKDTDIREIQYESSGSGTGSQKPVGFPSEIADIVIRCLDLSEHYGIDLASIILEKHQYNITRSYKHGGKRI